jgi:hypothetical protein
MPYRKDPHDEPARRLHWRSADDERFGRRVEPSEAGRYSSDQARYYGADSRSFSPPPLHRAQEARPAWRRNRFDVEGGSEASYVYDEEDALTRGYYSLDGPHGGQEYGIEPHGYRERLVRRPQRPAAASDDDLTLDMRDPGVREFGPPADYAYHPHLGAEFEPDYLDWREAQLRGHDRDYAAWREEQQARYDRDYRAFRDERQGRFGASFADWRRERDRKAPPEDKV